MGFIRDIAIARALGRIGARLKRKPVMVLGRHEGRAPQIASQLHMLDLRFRVEDRLYDGLSELAVSPESWSLAILVADDLGGVTVARRSCDWLRQTAQDLPTMIAGADFPESVAVMPVRCAAAEPVSAVGRAKAA